MLTYRHRQVRDHLIFRSSKFFALLAAIVLLVALAVNLAQGQEASENPNENPGRTLHNLPAQSGAVDLSIDGIEVTQSVQNLNNSVSLISGKRTFVRVYARSSEGTHLTTARLRLESGLASTSLLPINPPGWLLNVRPSYLRIVNNHAFLFEIPVFWTIPPNVKLTAEINPNLMWWPRNPVETTYANNSLTRDISFEPVPTLHVVIAAQPYTFNGDTYTPSLFEQFKLYTWLKQVFPVSNIKLYLRSLPPVPAVRQMTSSTGGWRMIYPSCGVMNSLLSSRRTSLVGSFYPDDTVFYGMVADDVAFMRGCAPGIPKYTYPVRVASGPTGSGNFDWDQDRTYGDWYGGHEIAHTFGRWHIRGGPGQVDGSCGGEAKAAKGYPDGRISPTTNLLAPNANYGFDARNQTAGLTPINGPNWHDLMTYCDYQWISDTTYEQLLTTFTQVLPLQQEIRQQAAEPLLGIFGFITLGSPETAELLPIFMLNADPPAQRSGSYAIVQRDAAGTELSRYPFTPLENELGPSPNDESGYPILYIQELVPPEPNLARLEIENSSGAVIGAIEAGLGVPRVKVLAPNGGEVINGEIAFPVSWEATDPDGDPMAYSVDYSPDGGATWEPVATAVSETQVNLSNYNFPAAEQGMIRVRATDGLHTGQDVSDNPFVVPNHLPQVEILSPAEGTTIAAGQTLLLAAQGYDIDLGSLGHEQMRWVSSEDGDLGTGETLAIASLREGQHEITLEIDDGQGGILSESRVIQVVENPAALPPPANDLIAVPELVQLVPSQGLIDAQLFIENANPTQVVAWSAIVDQPWLSLSAGEGMTPEEITATIDTDGLLPGTYTANVIVTSRDLPQESESILVSFIVPRYSTAIPIVRR